MKQCPSCGVDCGRPNGACGYVVASGGPQRYELAYDGNGVYMARADKGAYVEYKVYAALLAELLNRDIAANVDKPQLTQKDAMKLAKQSYAYTSSELTTSPSITMTAGNLVRFFELASKEYKP